MPDTTERQETVPEAAPSIWKMAFEEAIWTFLAAAIFLTIFYALAFKHIHPEFVPFIEQDANCPRQRPSPHILRQGSQRR